MIVRQRVVLDTNTLISRLLVPRSVPAKAVRQTTSTHTVLASDATIIELADVLSRRKFDPYITIEKRKEFLRLFGRIAEHVPILHVVRVVSESSRRPAFCCSDRPVQGGLIGRSRRVVRIPRIHDPGQS
jgi:predicted nucleic acid-binding protein